MPMQNQMLPQQGSPLFSKLTAELRHEIYTADKSVLAKLEQTCQRIGAEVDVLVDAKSVNTDASAWSAVRKLHYGNAAGSPLETPKTAKEVCKTAHWEWLFDRMEKGMEKGIENLRIAIRDEPYTDQRHLLLEDLRNKMELREKMKDAMSQMKHAMSYAAQCFEVCRATSDIMRNCR